VRAFCDCLADFDVSPTFLSRREVKAVYAACGGAGGRGLGYADFTAALAHAALTALSKPAFTHLYPTPRDKVLVLLEMWGLADERKLAEIARLGRR
jgi:hypothetical protein